jgi:hypothetical protein
MSEIQIVPATVTGKASALRMIAPLMRNCGALNEYRQRRECLDVHGRMEITMPITVNGEEEYWAVHVSAYVPLYQTTLRFVRVTNTDHLGAKHFVTAESQIGWWVFKQQLEIQPL